jgi:hypothetical protein
VPPTAPVATSVARRSNRRAGGCVVMTTTVVESGSARPQRSIKPVLSRAGDRLGDQQPLPPDAGTTSGVAPCSAR